MDEVRPIDVERAPPTAENVIDSVRAGVTALTGAPPRHRANSGIDPNAYWQRHRTAGSVDVQHARLDPPAHHLAVGLNYFTRNNGGLKPVGGGYYKITAVSTAPVRAWRSSDGITENNALG